jgi:hypothetical protein
MSAFIVRSDSAILLVQRFHRWNSIPFRTLSGKLIATSTKEADMGFGRGALLWLLGVPIPIIILLALFWHH